jgi:hypothetical protein
MFVGHVVHVDDPEGEYVPAEHVLHTDDMVPPVPAKYVPAGHGVHDDEPVLPA